MGCTQVGVHGQHLSLCGAYAARGGGGGRRCWPCAGQMLGELGSRQQTRSRSTVRMTKGGGGRRGRSCEKSLKGKKAPVFSQGLLTDTKSVFVCLPGCQIKEFLCVGGSDRVYLTLQLLL